MKFRRIMAVLIAVLMVLTVIPAAAFAVTDPAPEKDAEEAVKTEAEPKPEKIAPEFKSLADHLYTAGTYLPLTNYVPGFTEQEATTDGTTSYWIESNNQGQANTDAMLTIDSFYMNYGETITFQYWYETESSWDTFKFMDNNTAVFTKSGSMTNGWETYTYTCTSSGQHEFDFVYHKDGSNDTGADCVRIAYLTYSKQKAFYLTRAALNQGMSGNIISVETSGTYPFYVKETTSSGHELYLYSGNKAANNSTSTLTVKAWVDQPSVDFIFQYAISTEATYDYFKFSVNGTEVYRTSGHNDYSWQTYSYTCETQNLYTFTFEYIKDGNINQGEDVVCIDNLRFAQQDAGQRAADYNYHWFDEESNLNAVNTDAFLTFNSPKGTSSFVGTNNVGGNDYRAINNNRYVEGSDAYIETIVNMAAGEGLSFQYLVSSEDGYDGLRFDVNGDTELFASGWQESSWRSFTYTAPSTGTYVMRWQYHKDGTDTEGYDYAMIDSVRYIGSHSYGNATDGWGYHNTFSLEDALLSSANQGDCNVYSDVYDGNEYFLPYNDGTNNCLISRNKYYESTSAYADVYCYNLVPGDVISFDYTVRSESTDKLRVIIDANGTSNDVNQLFNGNANDSWHTFTWTCQYAETVIVSFEFAKDASVNTEPDCCMLRNFKVTNASTPTLDTAMNSSGSSMHFTSSGTYYWTPGYLGSDLCAMPTNRFNLSGSGATCTATVSTTVYLDYGAVFSFQYKADIDDGTYSDWTPSFTCTVTAVNTNTILNLNKTANVSSWTTKNYTAFTSGFYTFTWTYTRPQQGWEFEPFDVVAVRNCSATPDAGVDWPSIDEALNVEDGTLHFDNDAVWSDYWYDDDIITSATWGEASSNATLTTSVQMAAGDTLRFQYFVSSEQDYDYLVFRVNNSNVFTASGLVEWEWYDWTAPSAGTYQFEWTYHKDGSINRGMDCFKLDYVEHITSGTPGGMLGDVNGDGTIDISDALLAMRCAMGIITLNSEQRYRADVNGDGSIDISDALIIMRVAMGILSL